MAKQRIQKVLSNLGIASRRETEALIVEGRIRVNGEVVRDLPCFVDPDVDEVRVDGQRVEARAAEPMYFLLNKPKGVVCTRSDPGGRRRAVDLVPAAPGEVHCVGRLDKDSTGLILLTNDGDLTNKLTHPRYGVEKTYVVDVDGRLSGEQIETLKRGVYLDGKRTQGAGVKVLKRSHSSTVLEIRLREGRNREIRRMLARLGFKVRRLRRTAIGPVTDRGVKPGSWRPLRPAEIDALRRAAED